jgi:hypothetical protein
LLRLELQGMLITCWAQLPDSCRELLRPPLLLLAADGDSRLRQAGLAFWDEELPRGLAARLTVRGGLPACARAAVSEHHPGHRR